MKYLETDEDPEFALCGVPLSSKRGHGEDDQTSIGDNANCGRNLENSLPCAYQVKYKVEQKRLRSNSVGLGDEHKRSEEAVQ
jgi:hypothetical protein